MYFSNDKQDFFLKGEQDYFLKIIFKDKVDAQKQNTKCDRHSRQS